VDPGVVPGPALDAEIGTSLQAFAMILMGACPAGSPVDFPVVDVRDLAAVQVAAMAPVAGGRRLIAAGETWTMSRMAKEMRAAHPDRAGKIPVGVLPASTVRMLSLFDGSSEEIAGWPRRQSRRRQRLHRHADRRCVHDRRRSCPLGLARADRTRAGLTPTAPAPP
jgi:nucleoside-diphosphate-sugar epimerase